jgi:hypothetical protein
VPCPFPSANWRACQPLSGCPSRAFLIRFIFPCCILFQFLPTVRFTQFRLDRSHRFLLVGMRDANASLSTSLCPALASGLVQAVAFNPYDRALYLRVHNRTPFFCLSNWRNPFQGFTNSAAYRTVASAMYLFWQDAASRAVDVAHPAATSGQRSTFVGFAAGTMNGILLNPLQLVKFRMWSIGDHATFGSSFRELARVGGPSVFVRGMGISIARDVCFGVAYESLRRDRRDEPVLHRLASDCAAGMAASVFSSPFNFARNLIYGAPPSGCPLSTMTLCSYLIKETMSLTTARTRLAHINSRLNVGWGTLRVGVGMASGQLLFRYVQDSMLAREHHLGAVVALHRV